MFDVFGEIATSISRNKLRIALTGFSIAWGIFMLIILLGAGNGLLHGMMSNFGSSAQNNIQMWPGRTSKPYQGLPKNRKIYFQANDVEFLKQQFPDVIENIIPTIRVSARITYKQDYCSARIYGYYSDYASSGSTKIIAGRDINDIDIRERRKIILLNEPTAKKLFLHGEDPIGQWVNLYNVPFMVVGLYRNNNTRFNNNDEGFAPLTTLAAIFKPDHYYSEMRLMIRNLETADANKAFNDKLRTDFGLYKHFDKEDNSAYYDWNNNEEYLQTLGILNGLRLFIWIIGLTTLIAGVVGVCNIMLITVRERTREFGIRKALGASPRSIVWLVLLESVGITMLFGYIGMLCGVGVTQLADYIISSNASGNSGSMTTFLNPTVDMTVVLMANGVMILAGVIAGYLPAKRAVSIKPVDALAG